MIDVRSDGKWLMSSVRDQRVEISSPADQLRELEGLVGTWAAEGNGAKMESSVAGLPATTSSSAVTQ